MSYIVLALTAAIALLSRTDDKTAEASAPPAKVEVELSPDSIELEAIRPYERRNRYEVWQYYAVDRQGRFRPRVIYSPEGSYYLRNGEPYPYLPVRTREFMPYVSN
jgi:hypothetical protein